MGRKAKVVICGAGIAGISAAYYLAAKHGFENVLLVDQDAPLALEHFPSGALLPPPDHLAHGSEIPQDPEGKSR